MDLGDLGNLKPYVELAGQIVTGGMALGAAVTGKFPWAPTTKGLPEFAARVFGIASGVGLAYLIVRNRSVIDAPDFLQWAICLCIAGVAGAVLYYLMRLLLVFDCPGDSEEYVAGFCLQPAARSVLKGQLAGLPEQYAKTQPPLPVEPREFFCRSGKDPRFIWRGGCHVLAQLVLFLSYGLLIVPLSLAIASAAIAWNQVKVEKTPASTTIELPSDVLFDFDKSDLQANAAPLLEQIAADLRAHKVRKLRVEGHTDSKGDAAYNQRLSEQRAAVVAKWLTEKGGLGDARITATGFGATRPIAPNVVDGKDNPEGRGKNRRVGIVIDDPT